MYSRLDPVFQSLPRQTENADTRQDIRREEKTGDERRKGGKDKEEKPAELWEDSTVVSVRALHAFLTGLVADNAGKGHAEIQVSAAAAPQPPAQHREHPPTEAARAAKAYKTMYYTGQKEHQPPLPAPPAIENGVKLSPEEERTIHKLVADINILAASGIETLQIKKSESFLQSLVDAAALALKS